MNKKDKIFFTIIIALVIALIIMFVLYIDMRKNAKNNFNEMLNVIDQNHELNRKVYDLEEELNNISNTINN